MFTKPIGFLLFFLGMFALICGDTFDECEGKDDETYVEVKEDCSFYIFCQGDESFSDSCPEESPYFSAEEQACDADRSVCEDRPIQNAVSAATTVKEEENSTAAVTNTPAYSTASTTITVPSTTATTGTTLATTTTSTSSSTIAQSTTTSTVHQTVSTTVMPFSCPAVDNFNKIVFLPHTKSCSEYFLCYQGERLPMSCSNMLHFNVRQQKCDYPENARCQMMNVASPREQCLPHTLDLYPHPRNCNYYYQCVFGYLSVMQCPLNMGWHYEKRACMMRPLAKCYNSMPKSLIN